MSIIRNGVFYKEQPAPLKSSPEWKRWHMQTQRQDHLGDIQQRYIHGKPNGEWIRLFPEEAKSQFTGEEIRRYGNNYGSD